jgi:hypothetical protein
MNGSLVDYDDVSSVSDINNTADFVIGYEIWDDSYFLNGTIDEIRLYGRALSHSDVSELYLYDIEHYESEFVLLSNETGCFNSTHYFVNETYLERWVLDNRNESMIIDNVGVYNTTSWLARSGLPSSVCHINVTTIGGGGGVDSFINVSVDGQYIGENTHSGVGMNVQTLVNDTCYSITDCNFTFNHWGGPTTSGGSFRLRGGLGDFDSGQLVDALFSYQGYIDVYIILSNDTFVSNLTYYGCPEYYRCTGEGVCLDMRYCGDGICDAELGETVSSCPKDCMTGPSRVWLTLIPFAMALGTLAFAIRGLNAGSFTTEEFVKLSAVVLVLLVISGALFSAS